jgi:hypothetical protein
MKDVACWLKVVKGKDVSFHFCPRTATPQRITTLSYHGSTVYDKQSYNTNSGEVVALVDITVVP